MTESEELDFEVGYLNYWMDEMIIVQKMRAISNVADVLFEPSLTSPKYTGTFADGQRVSFDPFTVDWVQLERTCRHWSQRLLWRQFAKFLNDDLTKRTSDAIAKMAIGSEYGRPMTTEELENEGRKIEEKRRLNEKYGRVAK